MGNKLQGFPPGKKIGKPFSRKKNKKAFTNKIFRSTMTDEPLWKICKVYTVYSVIPLFIIKWKHASFLLSLFQPSHASITSVGKYENYKKQLSAVCLFVHRFLNGMSSFGWYTVGYVWGTYPGHIPPKLQVDYLVE